MFIASRYQLFTKLLTSFLEKLIVQRFKVCLVLLVILEFLGRLTVQDLDDVLRNLNVKFRFVLFHFPAVDEKVGANCQNLLEVRNFEVTEH